MRSYQTVGYPPPPHFTEVVDVRSPGEFAEDHVPGAVNLPVLDDAERERVGTLFRRDKLAARRLGAALVSRRIADHLEGHFREKPPGYAPLLYCWRGGDRSRSLATVLASVGWRTGVIEGGYRTYRRHVRARTAELAPALPWRVLAGLTGSGKTRVLHALAAAGDPGAVIDLEALARHRGSLFGIGRGESQPSQKRFESLLLEAMEEAAAGATAERGAGAVWVEGESRRIGRLRIPDALWEALAAAPVTELEAPREARARFVVDEYADLLEDPAYIEEILLALKEHCGADPVEAWIELARARRWVELAGGLLEHHYDPAYRRSLGRDFQAPERTVQLGSPDAEGFARAAGELVEGSAS